MGCSQACGVVSANSSSAQPAPASNHTYHYSTLLVEYNPGKVSHYLLWGYLLIPARQQQQHQAGLVCGPCQGAGPGEDSRGPGHPQMVFHKAAFCDTYK